MDVRFTPAGNPLAVRYNGRIWAVMADPVHWFARDAWWETRRKAAAPQPKTAAMLQQRKKDSKTKRQAVVSAIEALERTHTPITVAEVARRARVSPWLVRQEPLLDQVRKAQTRAATGDTAQGGAAAGSTAGSLHVERDLLRQENRRLREQIGREQQRISELLGDQIDGTDAQSQRLLAQELTAQNTVLSQRASDALLKLDQLDQRITALSADLHAAHVVNRALMTQLNRRKPS